MLYAIPSTSHLPVIMKKLHLALQANFTRSSSRVRTVSLSILFLQVKQGLEYPLECIPKVVNLLTDPTTEVEVICGMSVIDTKFGVILIILYK